MFLIQTYLFGHYYVRKIAFFGLILSIISICKSATQQELELNLVVHFVAVTNRILVVDQTSFRVLLVHALRFRSDFEQLTREGPGTSTRGPKKVEWANAPFVRSLGQRCKGTADQIRLKISDLITYLLIAVIMARIFLFLIYAFFILASKLLLKNVRSVDRSAFVEAR